MSAASQGGKRLIASAGSVDGAIDEACHRIVYFQRIGNRKLEALTRKQLDWLKEHKTRQETT